MILDGTTVATVDLEQLVVALRRWYEATGDARPNRILADLGKIRARNNGTPAELVERGLLLLAVRRWGPLEVPDPYSDDDRDQEVALAVARVRAPYSRRDPYPRGVAGPRKP